MIPASDDLREEAREAFARGRTRLFITVEARRYGKPMTIVDGFPRDVHVDEVAQVLKRRLGAGGGDKHGRLELQGDHAKRLRPMLQEMGFTVA